MKYLAFLFFLSTAYAGDPVKVAVIDSGLNLQDPRISDVLCKEGHKDFTQSGIEDRHGHGTFIVGKIKEYAKNANYCIIILKYYEPGAPDILSGARSRLALKEAKSLNVDFVNYSGGGNAVEEEEYLTISLSKNTTFVAAAGNSDQKLIRYSNCYYPACYKLPNIIVVGSLNSQKKKAPSSNYGPIVTVWEIGEDVEGLALYKGVIKMSGTSVATAIHTGKLVRARSRH